MKLSEHFTLSEFTRSDYAARHGIIILPVDAELTALKRLCETVLEPLRAALDAPIHILSGYRPPALNKAIGGSDRSAHLDGRAADLWVRDLAPTKVAMAARKIKAIDQVIVEFGAWTHVAVAAPGSTPRGQVLIARHQKNGRVVYVVA